MLLIKNDVQSIIYCVQEQANLRLKIEGMDQELSEKHYVYKQAESEREMYEQKCKLYREKVADMEVQVSKLQHKKQTVENEIQSLERSAAKDMQIKEEKICTLRKKLTSVTAKLKKSRKLCEQLQEERQKYELQMVEKSTEVKMLREAKEELKAQLEQERKRFDQHLLEQSVKKMHLQSVPQPMQGVNPLTPTPSNPSENTAEEKPSSDVDSALRSSCDQLREPAELHENPKGPPVKERKKTNHPLQEIRSRFESEPIKMCVQSPHTIPRLAEQMMIQCSCDTMVKPLIYVLDMTPDKSRKKLSVIEKYTFGPKPKRRITNRVLVIVGATGAGKTTLINGMINYIFGVRWEDTFRFKMVVENAVTQAESVTQKITAYTIYHQEGSPLNFSLTIVDTPGFGDTKGLERDKKIISQIFSLSPSEGGVDHLDAIGFVMQAYLARLTPTQRYIFDSILSVFGKNVGSNIFMMITFADGNKPPVVDAIKAANIPYRKIFKFSNFSIFPRSEQTHQDAFDSSGEEDEGGDFSRMFWDMGMKSFENFFTRFRVVEPQSLQLTNEVLQERQRLETTINSLQPQINERLAKIEELRREEQILKEHIHSVDEKQKVHIQAMIKAINDRLSQLDEHFMEMIGQVRDSSKRLGEIALKPNPLTEVEYIDLLIESEKQEAKPGYQARIKYYQDVRKRAQLATGVISMPNPAGRRGSPAHDSLWTSLRNLW